MEANQGMSDHQITENPCLAMHVLPTHDSIPACNQEEINVNFLYELDHKKLPPKSPIQLKAIRAVMVTEKTGLNITVRFPSTLSLRKYFSSSSTRRDMYPRLDEQFVMRLNLAKEILIRQVLPQKFAQLRQLESFWLVTPKVTKEDVVSQVISKENVVSPVTKEGTSLGEEDSLGNGGLCCSDLGLHWGVRRRITFIGRHGVKTPQVVPPPSSSLVKEVKANDEDEAGKKNGVKKAEAKKKSKKRKLESLSRKRKAKLAVVEQSDSEDEEEVKTEIIETKAPKTWPKKKVVAFDRWSKERYETAEEKMLQIMKAQEAVFGKPILRPALRLEARKHIGDTGLLDHLLKHMSGKIAPNGEDRFRRRHNAEGAMEYWLEKADLANIRKEAGVKDPYWTPPPGWVPGDSPSQDPICARELKMLKEEMLNMKKAVEELQLLKGRDEDEGAIVVALAPKSSSNCLEMESDITTDIPTTTAAEVSAQEIYENLVKRKTQLEKRLAEISDSLNSIQEEMGKLPNTKTTSKVGEGGKTPEEVEAVLCVVEEDKPKKAEDKAEEGGAGAGAEKAEEKSAKIERLRSGFRICKPQGTFLWPNMSVSAGSTTTTNNNNMQQHLSPQVLVHQHAEDMFAVPTPPSVSSATSAPPRLLALPPPPPPTSPVKPKPERRSASLTLSSAIGEGDTDMDTICACDHGGGGGGGSLFQEYQYHQQQGFARASSSSSIAAAQYHHQFVLPTINTTVAAAAAHETHSCPVGSYGPVKRTYQRKQQRLHRKLDSHGVYGGGATAMGTWLALATPSPNHSSSFAD